MSTIPQAYNQGTGSINVTSSNPPRGIIQTSPLQTYSARAQETVANTYEETAINLLVPTGEVFVVVAANLDVEGPDMIGGTDTATVAALATTPQINAIGINLPECVASTRVDIRSDAPGTQVSFTRKGSDVPTTLPYIYIVDTGELYLGVVGRSNTDPKFVNARIFGYRAKLS